MMKLSLLSLLYKFLYGVMTWRMMGRFGSKSGLGPSGFFKIKESWWTKNGKPISVCLGSVILANACVNISSDRPLGIRQIFSYVFFLMGDELIRSAEITLGKFFRTGIQKDHQLIATGLYQYVCHPAYIGFLICFFFMSLYSFDYQQTVDLWCSIYNIYNIGAMVMFLFSSVFFFACRIPEEELMMEKKFGSRWLFYKNGTYGVFIRLKPSLEYWLKKIWEE